MAVLLGALLVGCTSSAGGGGRDAGGFALDGHEEEAGSRQISLVQPVEWCYGASVAITVVSEGPCFVRHEGKCELCPGPVTGNVFFADKPPAFAPIKLYCKNAKKDCDASCWYPPDRQCFDLHPPAP